MKRKRPTRKQVIETLWMLFWIYLIAGGFLTAFWYGMKGGMGSVG